MNKVFTILIFIMTGTVAFSQKLEKLKQAAYPLRDYPVRNEELLQDKKWYIDLSVYKKSQKLILSKDMLSESFFYFKDKQNVTLNINENTCKCTLTGLYDIYLHIISDSNKVVTQQNIIPMFKFNTDVVPDCARRMVMSLQSLGMHAFYDSINGKIIFTESLEPVKSF